MLSNYDLGDSVASGYSHYSLDSNIIPIATVSRYHKFLTSVSIQLSLLVLSLS